MGGDKDFMKAHHSLIDPLIELDPSEETGLNTHFRSTFAPRQSPPSPPTSAGLKNEGGSAGIRHQHTGSSVETNPYRRSRASTVTNSPAKPSFGETTPRRTQQYPSPPNSASPRRERFSGSSHRSDAFGSLNEGRPRRSSQPSSNTNPFQDGGLSRGGSLRERYPGDASHRPLDIIRKDTKTAHRAHHLRKKNFQGADIIDRLDKTTLTVSYHHEGPYDAANLARNLDPHYSPVAAVKDTNAEALRATPRENIVDALKKHRPLEGVALVAPGLPDRLGRTFDYEEGTDLMREPGADYKRWPGVTYRDDDLKGKGEPSFTEERALKDRNERGDSGIELQTRHRKNHSAGAADAPAAIPVETLDGVAGAGRDSTAGVGRSNTTGKSMGNALKKRFGSIRRRKVDA